MHLCVTDEALTKQLLWLRKLDTSFIFIFMCVLIALLFWSFVIIELISGFSEIYMRVTAVV